MGLFALAKSPKSFYSVSMRDFKTGAIILGVIGLILLPLSLGAQEKQLIKAVEDLATGSGAKRAIKGAKGATSLYPVSKVPHKTPDPVYKWPEQVQQFPSAGKTSRVPANSRAKNVSFDAPLKQPTATANELRSALLSTLQQETDIPVQAHILQAVRDESVFYAEQIQRGEALRTKLENMPSVSPQSVYELSLEVLKLDSYSLKKLLLESLQKGDIYAVYQDVTDFYGLSGDMAGSIINFLARHPHKPTLMLRRLLRHPLVPEELRRQAANLLSKHELTDADLRQMRQLVIQMQTGYLEQIQRIETSGDMVAYVEFCQQLRDRLRAFQQKNGRNPWIMDDTAMSLYQDLNWLFRQNDALHFGPLQAEVNTLKAVWSSGEKGTYEQVIHRLQEFQKQFGHNPRWVAIDSQEFGLWEEINHLLQRVGPAGFVDAPPELAVLQQVWASSSEQVASLEDTLKRYEAFVRAHPNSNCYPSNAQWDKDISPEENALFEDLMYWRRETGEQIVNMMRDIRAKYAQP